ncbi:hypothetical protein M0802_007562 [Mischocyttarus mexicanus]|nr:hypothetical protein M0802_007562 [Mischocyttarus mexicanus]
MEFQRKAEESIAQDTGWGKKGWASGVSVLSPQGIREAFLHQGQGRGSRWLTDGAELIFISVQKGLEGGVNLHVSFGATDPSHHQRRYGAAITAEELKYYPAVDASVGDADADDGGGWLVGSLVGPFDPVSVTPS